MDGSVVANSIVGYFASIRDYRVDRRRRHNLVDIIVIATLGVICGADSWTSIQAFGEAKKDWLETFLELPNGIPSHDTFGRFFSMLDPEVFAECFIRWISTLGTTTTSGSTVAIDGKAIRGSFDKASGKAAIHMVSAWASEHGIILAQKKVTEKSNEITAIPKLLDVIDLEGVTITIDAMGTQKKIAEKIIAGGGSYVLALKGNQGNLHNDIKLAFEGATQGTLNERCDDSDQTVDGGHGRVETRNYWVSSNLEGFSTAGWKGLKAIGIADRTREVGGIDSTERSYFLLSEKMTAADFGKSARAHWSIENNLHWSLDVAFNEDKSRVRKGHGAENFSTIRKLSLSLLKNVQAKPGIAIKRQMAGWDNKFLIRVLLTGTEVK